MMNHYSNLQELLEYLIHQIIVGTLSVQFFFCMHCGFAWDSSVRDILLQASFLDQISLVNKKSHTLCN